jgi:DNA replication protein
MKTFSGFSSGTNQSVSLPEQFFTELLPLIDDALELKVTLACFRWFDQKSGLARWTTLEELQADPALNDVRAGIEAGLVKAVERGSIVRARDQARAQWLFPNDDFGRAAAAAIERGEAIESIPSIAQRPNIFTLYEQTIGALTPILADQLRAAEREFSPQLIEEAFQEAARQNVRSWAYVKKILDRRSHREKHDEAFRRDVGAKWQEDLKKYRGK